jgi:hypothetical protein
MPPSHFGTRRTVGVSPLVCHPANGGRQPTPTQPTGLSPGEPVGLTPTGFVTGGLTPTVRPLVSPREPAGHTGGLTPTVRRGNRRAHAHRSPTGGLTPTVRRGKPAGSRPPFAEGNRRAHAHRSPREPAGSRPPFAEGTGGLTPTVRREPAGSRPPFAKGKPAGSRPPFAKGTGGLTPTVRRGKPAGRHKNGIKPIGLDKHKPYCCAAMRSFRRSSSERSKGRRWNQASSSALQITLTAMAGAV